MYIGPKALTFQESAIVGYGRADGLPRNLLDVGGAALKVPADKIAPRFGTRTYQLEDLLHLPQLFEAYPEFRSVDVRVKPDKRPRISGTLGCQGSYDTYTGKMELKPREGATEADILEALGHETQHLIQQREGFRPGVNSIGEYEKAIREKGERLRSALALARQHKKSKAAERINNLLMAQTTIETDGESHLPVGPPLMKQMERAGWRRYWNNPGEVEARKASEFVLGNGGSIVHEHLRNTAKDVLGKKDMFLRQAGPLPEQVVSPVQQSVLDRFEQLRRNPVVEKPVSRPVTIISVLQNVFTVLSGRKQPAPGMASTTKPPQP